MSDPADDVEDFQHFGPQYRLRGRAIADAEAAERLRCAEAAKDWFTLPPRFRTKENLLKSILKE